MFLKLRKSNFDRAEPTDDVRCAGEHAGRDIDATVTQRKESTMIDIIDASTGMTWPDGGGASTPVAGMAAPPPNGSVLLASARRSLVTWFQVALATIGLSLMVSPDGLHALMSAVRNPPELVILDDDLEGVDADWVEQMLGRDARTASARIMRVKSLIDAPADGHDHDQDRKANRIPMAGS
jgi:hypothetical protein